MADTDYSTVLRELDALETEIEAIHVAVDEGEETFSAAPTAREVALRHLESAMRLVASSSQAVIKETDWDEPEDAVEAIETLVVQDVLPGRVGATLVALAEYATKHSDDSGWEADEDATGAFERLSEGVEALAEYQEYVHHFLREWEG